MNNPTAYAVMNSLCAGICFALVFVNAALGNVFLALGCAVGFLINVAAAYLNARKL